MKENTMKENTNELSQAQATEKPTSKRKHAPSRRDRAMAWFRKHTPGVLAALEAKGEGKIELHHVDPELKRRDPKRYREWRHEDLVPVTLTEHRRIHSRPFDKAHSLNMRISLYAFYDRNDRRVVVDGEFVFPTARAAAKFIGCSRQLVSHCLSPNHEEYRHAYGHTVVYFADMEKNAL